MLFLETNSCQDRIKSFTEHEKPIIRRTKHRKVFEHVLADIESAKFKESERFPSEAEPVKSFAPARKQDCHTVLTFRVRFL